MSAVAFRTHIGHVRKRNEDSLYVGEYLYAVADGLGGHAAGDDASAAVIDAIKAYDRATAAGDLSAALGKAVHAATVAMRHRVTQDHSLAGMGSTLVAMLRSGMSAAIANVGDSRGYLLRGRKLIPVTEDHVYGHLVFGAQGVPNLPERITRFLDGRPDGRSPDLTPLQLRDGDRVLLCTDGLSSFVGRGVIRELLTGGGPDTAVERLIGAALEAGGPDNITVVVVDA